MKIAQIQLKVTEDKDENIRQLAGIMDQLDSGTPDLIALGEMFCCPYGAADIAGYAEPEGGRMWTELSGLARKHGVWLSAGSVPECDDEGHVFNTAYVFDRNGKMAAKHRKVHMFDVDIPGGKSFRESDTFTPGDRITVFHTEFGPVGLCVCFDIRFPEMARKMAEEGVFLILVPANFTRKTGEDHWELLFRARAVDNQCFYAGISTAFDEDAPYHSYGHSILTSPWGEVIAQAGDAPAVLVNEIDPALCASIRARLPVL